MRWHVLVLSAVAVAIATAADGQVLAADPRLPARSDVHAISIAKRTFLDLYVTAREAAAALSRHSDMVLVDVRPTDVIARAGAPAFAAIRVPLLVKSPSTLSSDEPAMQVDPAFTEKVRAALREQRRSATTTLLMLCVAGVHASRAADLLAEAGHKNVYVIVDGYDGNFDAEHSLGGKGWRNEDLPVVPPSAPRAAGDRP